MLGSDIIDVAIGMCLIFLMASLICTGVQEALEGILKNRASDLEKGLRELLNDPEGSTIVKAFYEHPMIFSLFSGKYDSAKPNNLPSYIPAGSFASALIDIVARGSVQQPNSPYPALGAALVPTVTQLRSAVQTLPSERLQRALLVAIDQAKGDMDEVKKNLETYFNSTMERVSGWYKRRTQVILFCIGLLMAGVLNIDAIYIADRLSQDKALRQAVVSQAEKMVPADSNAAQGTKLAELQQASIAQLRGQLTTVGIPVGWTWPARQYTNCDNTKPDIKPGSEQSGCMNGLWATPIYMVLGWFITAFAVMLGAPFWFDALSKLMTVRNSLKPKAKSPEQEAAEVPRTVHTLAAVGPAAAPALPDVQFEPHTWQNVKDDEKEKGVI